MQKLIDNDATVPKTGDWFQLGEGVFKVGLSTSDASASIALEQRIEEGPAMAITAHDGAVTLTTDDPSKIVDIADGEEVRAVRTGGTGAVTVYAIQMSRI